ncbi:hypothetical protein [Mesorhizobium huakuii]|uniref:Uncharacterized protein n=1 Tax=Mesorhizobium huakuii TaxID=28104 RepID=A0A7G6T0N1_9HYPH|nr:hypothetical protein [Mesorhizobium huakuii]QND60313.1 hypothetical protein HB778_30025 [Mesorhizobium huakuii]
MLAKAQAAAGKAALERQAAAARAEHYGPAAEALQTMYKLLAGVCHSALVLEQHALAIEGMNQQALGNDRRDLVIDMDILRRAVLDTIGTRHASIVVPVRTGETDEAFEARLWSVVASNAGVAPNGKKERGTTVSAAVLAECRAMHVERRANEGDDAYSARRWAAVAGALRLQLTNGETEADHRERLRYALARRLNVDRKGESDEAYQLRLANAHSALVTAREQSDPLRAVGEKALAAIKRHALGLEKIALHRQHAEVRELRPMSGDTDLMRRYGRRSD